MRLNVIFRFALLRIAHEEDMALHPFHYALTMLATCNKMYRENVRR